MGDTLTKEYHHLFSILYILRFFVAWGILEIILYMITKGNKIKELVFHIIIFILITLFVHYHPDVSEYIV